MFNHPLLLHYAQQAGLKKPKSGKEGKEGQTFSEFFFFQFCNISNTLFYQKSPVHWEPGFPGEDSQTDITTYRLNKPRVESEHASLQLEILICALGAYCLPTINPSSISGCFCVTSEQLSIGTILIQLRTIAQGRGKKNH